MIHLCHGYSVQLRVYYAWEKDVMNLIRLKYKLSAFHPESGTSFYRDKYHQLRYFICTFKDKEIIIFIHGDHGAFDEGENSIRNRYCPVRMYNKDKPTNIEWQMPSIISYIMCNKVRIQKTLTSTHHYTTYPLHRNLLIML